MTAFIPNISCSMCDSLCMHISINVSSHSACCVCDSGSHRCQTLSLIFRFVFVFPECRCFSKRENMSAHTDRRTDETWTPGSGSCSHRCHQEADIHAVILTGHSAEGKDALAAVKAVTHRKHLSAPDKTRCETNCSSSTGICRCPCNMFCSHSVLF